MKPKDLHGSTSDALLVRAVLAPSFTDEAKSRPLRIHFETKIGFSRGLSNHLRRRPADKVFRFRPRSLQARS